jgi:hypothetical protein
MMIKVPAAKFELYSSLVGINVYPKWLSNVESVFFILREIFTVHTKKEFVSR